MVMNIISLLLGVVIGSVATFIFHGGILSQIQTVLNDVVKAVNDIKAKLGV